MPIIGLGMAKVQFGVAVGALTGTSGNGVFARRSDGSVVLRQRVIPHNPQTSAQTASRERMQNARRIYATLTQEQHHAWEDFAQSGTAPSNRAYQSFLALATKYMQVNDTNTAPNEPPTEGFTGDGIIVTASAMTGAVRFSAALANTLGIVTELLIASVQGWSAPTGDDKYRHAAFVSFPTGGANVDIARAPGKYACAVRFVRTSTGQASELLRIGIVQVT